MIKSNYNSIDVSSIKISILNVDILFSTLVVLLPFLYQYAGIGSIVSLGEMLLIPFVFMYLLQSIRNHITSKSELLFYLEIIITTLLCVFFDYFRIRDSITVLLRMIFYSLLIHISIKHFKYKEGLEFYRILVIFFSVYLILQYIYHIITDDFLPTYISFNLLFPPEQRTSLFTENYNLYFRPSSFFLEPSYYTFFCLPYISIRPFQNLKKREIVELLIVYFSIILSGSSSGILALGIVFIFKIDNLFKKINIKKIFRVIIFAAMALLVIFCFSFIDFKILSIRRIQNGGSFPQRITRGIIIYNNLSLVHKIWGVGINNIGNYMNFNSFSTIYDEGNLNYCCSILQILNMSGLVGLVLFIRYISTIWEKIKFIQLARILFIIMIFVLSYEAAFYTYRFAFLCIFLLALNKDNKKF